MVKLAILKISHHSVKISKFLRHHTVKISKLSGEIKNFLEKISNIPVRISNFPVKPAISLGEEDNLQFPGGRGGDLAIYQRGK